ncbi:MAG: hypothetical protein LBL05_04000 [Synergistaceae bacterium]|nr:hypothetical protein [Synergistaceae bacterium]
MEEPKFVLKASNGKDDELLVFDDKVILQLWNSRAYSFFSIVLFLFVYILLFFAISKGGIILNGLFIVIGFFLAKGLLVKKYIFDFDEEKIYICSLDFIRRPIAKFTQIAGVRKVWQHGYNNEREFFFYKLSIKGIKFGKDIPLSGVHKYDDSFDKIFTEQVLSILLKFINEEDITENSLIFEQTDPLLLNYKVGRFRGRFKCEDGKIYYVIGIKRLTTIVFTNFLITVMAMSLIYLTNGLFILFLLIALFFDIKISLKKGFFILPGNNIYIAKEKKEFSASEIRSILVYKRRAAVFGIVGAIWIQTVLWNGENYTLKAFGIGERSEVDDFLNNLQRLVHRQINIEFVDNITLM